MEFITYIAKSAGILTLFYLVYVFVLRKDTFFTANRTFLLVGIASALLLPFVTFTAVTFVEAPIFFPTENLAEIIPTQSIQTVPIQETIDIWQLVFIAYLIGFAIMAIRFGIQLASLCNLLRKHPSKLANGFRFIEINDAMAPFSFFNYIVFNPETHEQQELEMILQHEKVHAAQWHSVDLLLSNIVRALQWANPISWLYQKSIEANLEFLADYQTASNVPSKTEYQLALLKASSPLPVPALTNNFYHSFIKKRIIMLNKSNSNKYKQFKLMVVLPALALFLWSFNTEEVIEYTTPALEVSAERELNNKLSTKKVSFSAKTTDAKLDELENYFTKNHPESLVKIADRKRDASGSLINFSFQTKFTGDDRFYTRFDRGPRAPFQTLYSIEPQETGVLLVSEIGKDGMQFKITAAQLELFLPEDKVFDLDSKSVKEKGLTKATEPMFGDNPLYIINGKEYRKNQLPADKTIALDGTIEVFNKKEGESIYGDKGKEGVLFFNGVSTVTKVKDKTIKADTKTKSTVDDIKIKITKNTTKAQLDGYKTELKRDHGIDFTYKNIDYNSKNEMTAISISYDGEGNSGSYGVKSDDGEPIEDFYFYMDTEKGTSGFGTASNPRLNEDRLAVLAETKKHLKNERKNLSGTRSELSEKRNELRASQANLRTEAAEMSASHANLKTEQAAMRASQANLRTEAAAMLEEQAQLAKTSYTINTNIHGLASEKILITKNTTDAQLKNMRFKLAERGIDFNYKKIKRNRTGEITGIKATFNNGKGSKVSKSIQSDDDEAIKMIVVEM
jgi:hypothetical protein